MTDDYAYETTPYGVEERGRKFVVRQVWWGKDISTHKTQAEADAACIEAARQAGLLRRVKLTKRKAKK
jgi:hypothetical protein